jgi:hypothetical protein
MYEQELGIVRCSDDEENEVMIGVLIDEGGEIGFSLFPKKLFRGLKKIVKSVVKSPIVKLAAGGAALAFPPALPAAAALAASDKLIRAAKGVLPSQKKAPPALSKKLQVAARRTIKNTYALAKRGNRNAQRGIRALKAAKHGRKLATAHARGRKQQVRGIKGQIYTGALVLTDGAMLRGRFRML